jgi:hypothetical protein
MMIRSYLNYVRDLQQRVSDIRQRPKDFGQPSIEIWVLDPTEKAVYIFDMQVDGGTKAIVYDSIEPWDWTNSPCPELVVWDKWNAFCQNAEIHAMTPENDTEDFTTPKQIFLKELSNDHEYAAAIVIANYRSGGVTHMQQMGFVGVPSSNWSSKLFLEYGYERQGRVVRDGQQVCRGGWYSEWQTV